MIEAGVPVVPGTDECVSEFGPAKEIADKIGYPVIIKPSGGGGGIGMTVVEDPGELAEALRTTQAIASTTFGIPDIYIEKIPAPSPSYRIPNTGRFPGECDSSGGARVFHPAKAPEADRGSTVSGDDTCHARRNGREGRRRSRLRGL